jgi:hypothetical protein
MHETPTSKNAERAMESGNTAGVHFVIQQLDLGLEYCHMASNADTEQNVLRFEANANRSYRAATYHVKSLILTRAEHTDFGRKEARLKSLLATLGA